MSYPHLSMELPLSTLTFLWSYSPFYGATHLSMELVGCGSSHVAYSMIGC